MSRRLICSPMLVENVRQTVSGIQDMLDRQRLRRSAVPGSDGVQYAAVLTPDFFGRLNLAQHGVHRPAQKAPMRFSRCCDQWVPGRTVDDEMKGAVEANLHGNVSVGNRNAAFIQGSASLSLEPS